MILSTKRTASCARVKSFKRAANRRRPGTGCLDPLPMTKQAVQTPGRQRSVKDNVISVAQAEAERIISEARLRAQQILGDAEERTQKAQRLERQLRERIRMTMESIWNSLTAEDAEATRPYRETIPGPESPEKTGLGS